jgi:hypothetical protein
MTVAASSGEQPEAKAKALSVAAFGLNLVAVETAGSVLAIGLANFPERDLQTLAGGREIKGKPSVVCSTGDELFDVVAGGVSTEEAVPVAPCLIMPETNLCPGSVGMLKTGAVVAVGVMILSSHQ